MKREVERERVLPAFSLSIGELELLMSRILELYDDPTDVHPVIDIRLPSEKLEFSSIQELREYDRLPSRITDFSIWFSHQGKRISMRSERTFDTGARVTATSETESWCAGAIDTVYSFVSTHKTWYNWFVSIPIGWLLFILGSVPIVAYVVIPKGYQLERWIFFAWMGAFASLLLLYVNRNKLLPSGIIQVSEHGGFIRNHTAELSLVLSVITVVVAVVGLIVAM